MDWFRWLRRRHRKPSPRDTLKRDWSVSLGPNATVGAANFPAKFSFDINRANCGGATQPISSSSIRASTDQARRQVSLLTTTSTRAVAAQCLRLLGLQYRRSCPQFRRALPGRFADSIHPDPAFAAHCKSRPFEMEGVGRRRNQHDARSDQHGAPQPVSNLHGTVHDHASLQWHSQRHQFVAFLRLHQRCAVRGR